MGLVDLVYGIFYAIGQFLWGFLGDRFGTRKIVLSGLFCSAATAVCMGVSSLVVLFGVLMGIQGLCQSTGWAPLSKNISNFFSVKERGRAMGWWSTNYAVGALVGPIFAGYVADSFGDWRFAFFGPALAVLLVAILFILLQKNRPEKRGFDRRRAGQRPGLDRWRCRRSVAWLDQGPMGVVGGLGNPGGLRPDRGRLSRAAVEFTPKRR